MTRRAGSARKRGAVHRLWSLLLVLIASSLVVTATVHAREFPGPVTLECTGFVHMEGDADQSQGDLEKAIPHHHGTCHGAAMSVPSPSTLKTASLDDALRPIAPAGDRLTSTGADPALRPPTA